VNIEPLDHLLSVTQSSRSRYASLVAGQAGSARWWTHVLLTASSERQADGYRLEIEERKKQGVLPPCEYRVVADPGDRRVGSGGATVHALHTITGSGDPEWWANQRVLMIHSGGDSRRLPQYSLSGKLFSALPIKTPWGGVCTVFDEFLALSTAWSSRMESGLLVASGDVLLVFDANEVRWDRGGIAGVAMRQPAKTGTQHGVYILGDEGRVYSFLQKPSIAEVESAGGLLEEGAVGLDTGLLHFSPNAAAWVASLPEPGDGEAMDLYQHLTLALTGQWSPAPSDGPALRALESARRFSFHADLVPGEFTHIGTTKLFRHLLTEDTDFSRLYSVRQRLGAVALPGVQSGGIIIDSVIDQGTIGAGAVVIESRISGRAEIARGAVVHGIEIDNKVVVPEDTVLHMIPVRTPEGRAGFVLRIYGVGDNPKQPLAGGALWMGRPFGDCLQALGIHADDVWAAGEERTLWNADLFPVLESPAAWQCALWMMSLPSDFTLEQWRSARRLSLAGSTECADREALAAQRSRRARAQWESSVVQLASADADLRPMLAQAPGTAALMQAGSRLLRESTVNLQEKPSVAASRAFQSGLFFAQAGLEAESDQARDAAFEAVRDAVKRGSGGAGLPGGPAWVLDAVHVAAPARIDFGGGWSDTPPFCLDWGGVVLNAAISLRGDYPIETRINRIPQALIRCIAGPERVEYTTSHSLLAPPAPGDPFSIPRTALQMTGLFNASARLDESLRSTGGGIEIRTAVRLPMGSGLGTSSILAATVIQAVAEMRGSRIGPQALSDLVLELEQRMSTGGGWQDQAGGIFPGVKLLSTGPGLRQRIRVQPLSWSLDRAAEFEELLVLGYTGINRIAKNLLQQVVGSYLARETGAVQVLHSIKTLALEMAHAMQAGEWDYLGELLDRHWALNQVLDPNTTNAPVQALLDSARPWIRGAKLAGAGGGGFFLFLAKSPSDARELRQWLAKEASANGVDAFDWQMAGDGLRVRREG
jgi:fucokinase